MNSKQYVNKKKLNEADQLRYRQERFNMVNRIISRDTSYSSIAEQIDKEITDARISGDDIKLLCIDEISNGIAKCIRKYILKY